MYEFSGKSRNFETRGHRPIAVEFLGSGDCFDVLFKYPMFFLVTVENKVQIVHCMMTTINVYTCYSQNV